jgi:acyl-coenzyme A thioesterase PaaI-like protein
MLLKETAIVRLIGLRIPMLLLIGPRVVELDGEGCAVLVPLTFLTKNHLIGAMYFGVLCAGADLAAGLPAAKLMLTRHRGMKLVFGELRAEFLKRADGDVLFRNRDAARIVAAVGEAAATGERVTVPVEVIATVPKRYGDEPVARFAMSLSLKAKGAARDAPGDADRAGGVLH